MSFEISHFDSFEQTLKWRNTIKQFYMIVHPEQTLPTDLQKAIESVNQMAKSDDHTDGGLSAVWVNIASGRYFTKTASLFADKATKDFKFMESATQDFQGVLDLVPVVTAGKPFNINEVLSTLDIGVKAVDKVVSQNSSNDLVKTFLGNAKDALYKILPSIGKTMIKDTILQWVSYANHLLESGAKNEVMKPIDTIDVSLCDLIVKKKVLEKVITDLTCATKMYSVISTLPRVFEGDIGHMKTESSVHFIKNLDNFIVLWQTHLDKVDSQATPMINKLIQNIKGFSAHNAVADSNQHARSLAEMMIKVAVNKKVMLAVGLLAARNCAHK